MTLLRRSAAPGMLAILALSCADLEGPIQPIEPPVFTHVAPQSQDVGITAGQSVAFVVQAQSPAGRALDYEYRVDDQPVAATPAYVFSPPDTGRYRVEALVSDGERTTTHAWSVTVARPPNVSPTAVLALDPASGFAPLVIRARLIGADPDGTITRYRLEVTGAVTIALERAAAIDTVLTLGEGAYSVTGTVEDDRGGRATAQGSVRVDEPPNIAPIPRLVVRPTSGKAPLDVVIEGGGSDPDGRIVEYALDLDGDGRFDVRSSSPLVQGTRFSAPGETFVRLSLTDNRGGTARDSVLVSVLAPSANVPPTLSITTSVSSGDAPLSVTARAVGSDADGSVVAVAIDFDGDGVPEASASRTELEATHTYPAEGTFTLRAVATDDRGATAAATATIVVRRPNLAPTGALTANATRGDAPVAVVLRASGSDADGSVVRWEIDADDGAGFAEVAPSGSRSVVYPFRASAYRPRLRLTDDRGAQSVIDGPAVAVYRPVSATLSAGGATGNPRFDGLSIAPAIWADGSDRLRFSVITRDHAGNPLPDVPVRVTSLRPGLVILGGPTLGGTVTIQLNGTTSDGTGRLTGELTTRTSSRAYAVPRVGAFVSFGLAIELDAGHGEWRRLPDITGLNAETIVNGNPGMGSFGVVPSGLVCVGTTVEIHVRAVRRDDAPGGSGPAAGMVTEIRYLDGTALQGLRPAPGYEGWRTDGTGRIVFRFTSTQPDSRGIQAWVDGQPLNIPATLAFQSC